MTANQVAYWNLQETKRSNQVKEAETNRSNVARETETHRANVSKEDYERKAAHARAEKDRADAQLSNAKTVRESVGTATDILTSGARIAGEVLKL